MPPETEETTDTTEAIADEGLAITDADVEKLHDAADEAEVEEEVELSPEEKVAAEKQARAALRIKDADDAEKKAEEIRAKRRKDRDDADREERFVARERQLEEGLRRIQTIEQELHQRRDRAMKGGLEGLKAIGLDYSELSREVLTANTPEAMAQQALDRADRLEKQLAKEREAAATARAQAEEQESKQRFIAVADANAEDYPHAAACSARLLTSLADEEARKYIRKYGHGPSFAALLPLVDEAAAKEHEEVKTRSAKRARPANDPPSDGAPNPRDTTGNGLHASKPAPRTLDGAAAGTKASAKRPMTDEEVDDWALQELRSAMKADKQPTR